MDRATVPSGWREGLVLRLSTAAGGGAVEVSVDYSGFRWAYGAEWASRLRLWQLHGCALADPGTGQRCRGHRHGRGAGGRPLRYRW